MRRLFILVFVFSLIGCSLPGARKQALSYFVLEAPTQVVPAIALPVVGQRPVLLLRDAEAGGFSQSLRLVYSRTPGTQAYYQYALWNEPPPKRLHTLLRQRLLASGLYAGVVPLGAGVQGDFQLNFRLLDFFHDAVKTPGTAQIKLEVELVERGSARLIAQQIFDAQVPLDRQDGAAAAAGLGQATGQVLDAVIAWLARVQPFSIDAA